MIFKERFIMIKSLSARLRQSYRTISYPKGPPPQLSDRFRGLPKTDWSLCPEGCALCSEICPTGAIRSAASSQDKPGSSAPAGDHVPGIFKNPEPPFLDLGKCLFCTDCEETCPAGAIAFGQEFALSSCTRRGLVLTEENPYPVTEKLPQKHLSLFRKSLKLRQVSAGGCNACEADINVLNTLAWDLGRFGIQFVASPRHADGILITGPVTANMLEALEKTYQAVPGPKIVIAVGSCAISGGLFEENFNTRSGAEGLLPIDLYIPGCPPHPLTILNGLLSLLGRLKYVSRI